MTCLLYSPHVQKGGTKDDCMTSAVLSVYLNLGSIQSTAPVPSQFLSSNVWLLLYTPDFWYWAPVLCFLKQEIFFFKADSIFSVHL